MSFGFDSPELDDAASWQDAQAAYDAALPLAKVWQPDARTALTDLGEYPPAHVNSEGEWAIVFWSPVTVKGLNLFLDSDLRYLRQAEWGAFYRDSAVELGTVALGVYGFEYRPEISQHGPENLVFVFRRPNPIDPTLHDFVDVQISTSVMLTPPPRRFTVNLVRNPEVRPMYGASGGFETRLGVLLPEPKPDYWWPFRDEAEYRARLDEAFELTVAYGLTALLAIK